MVSSANANGPRTNVLSSQSRARRRPHSVVQACQNCRRSKIKCNGSRPSCSTCSARNRTCQYEGSAGQSRKEASKSRLATLECLFDTLKSGSIGDAQQLLQQIRESGDFLDTSTTPSCQSFLSSSTSIGLCVTSNDGNVPQPAPSASDTPGSTSTGTTSSPITEYDQSDSPTENVLSALPVDSPLASPTAPAISSASVILAAIDSFYTSSGKLFHVFTADQALQKFQDVFGGESTSLEEHQREMALCCLYSIAAIGVQYKSGQFDKGTDVLFYNRARRYFAGFIEYQQLDALRVCAMLAMYNIMGKATSAIAYLALGLGMFQRQNSDDRLYGHPHASADTSGDLRRTWRVMMFLSSWLSSTLGYTFDKHMSFRDIAPFVDMEVDNTCASREVVEAEMTKISMLTADILRIHLSSWNLTEAAIDSVMAQLREWHRHLPRQMQLLNLAEQDLPLLTRLSIFHAHLLYLGAMILLYRRVLFQLARGSNDAVPEPLREKIIGCADQGITAARQSARILALLRADEGIFQKCWLVIFQSYISCVVLLHSVAKMQLNCPSASPRLWSDDLAAAGTCLDVLDFCSGADPVARRLFNILSPLRTQLLAFEPPSDSRSLEEAELTGATYLLTIPQGVDPKSTLLSQNLFVRLSCPFGLHGVDAGREGSADSNVSTLWQGAGDFDQLPLLRADCPSGWNLRGFV